MINQQPTCQLYPDGCLKSILYGENPGIWSQISGNPLRKTHWFWLMFLGGISFF